MSSSMRVGAKAMTSKSSALCRAPGSGEALGQRRLEGLDRVGGEEDGEPPVGDLCGQGHVLRSFGPQDDRDLLAQRMDDGLERLAQPGAARIGERIGGTVTGDRRLSGDHLAHDVHVLDGPGQRLLERLAVPSLDHLGPGHTEAEHEPPPRQMVEGDGGHAHGRRGAGRHLAQGGAEADPTGLRAPPAERGERIRAVGLGRPDRVETQALGLGHQLRCVGRRAGPPVAELQSELHVLHRFLPGA